MCRISYQWANEYNLLTNSNEIAIIKGDFFPKSQSSSVRRIKRQPGCNCEAEDNVQDDELQMKSRPNKEERPSLKMAF